MDQAAHKEHSYGGGSPGGGAPGGGPNQAPLPERVAALEVQQAHMARELSAIHGQTNNIDQKVDQMVSAQRRWAWTGAGVLIIATGLINIAGWLLTLVDWGALL